MSRLVIAEKPSVAASLAKVLKASARKDGYFEGNGWIVSWCVGHLVELEPPESYDEKYRKWRREDLPILPDYWRYAVSASTKKQFGILKKLMERSDVDRLCCATDAGREGELIFRLVYHQAHCKKPFDRLWISSMEDSAIQEGFASLRPSKDYDALYEAALCRERADWIVGMNATRLYSCLYGSTLNVGRVMTPTLAMLVEREQSIRDFVPETFYTVQLQSDGLKASGRKYKDRAEAEELADRCRSEGQMSVSKVVTKDKSEKPPLLYDLTSLQRDANKILGYSAQQTLDYLQSLYEKKLVTYPRTDSRYLTEDMAAGLPQLAKTAAGALEYSDPVSVNAKQVINNAKVSDHHAVIPTKEASTAKIRELPKGEAEILKLVTVRLLCAVGLPCRFTETTVTITCAGETFSIRGKQVLDPGWKAVMNHYYPAKEKEEVVPNVQEGQVLAISNAEVKEGKTKPAQHYTEGSLLRAMETAGAEDIPEEAERKGLGTPATRAGTIEKLIQKGFVIRSGDKKTKILLPTEKGTSLIAVMPEKLKSPMMTAEWEQKLLDMEHHSYDSGRFMGEIGAFVQELIDTQKAEQNILGLASGGEKLGICPVCGAEIIERKQSYSCTNRDCRFTLWKDNLFLQSIGKNLTRDLAVKLISGEKVKLKKCVSRKSGKTFDAVIWVTADVEGKASFSMELPQKGGRK